MQHMPNGLMSQQTSRQPAKSNKRARAKPTQQPWPHNKQTITRYHQTQEVCWASLTPSPTINKNNPVEDTVSPALRTDVIRNNVLELYINPNKGADIVGAKLFDLPPNKKRNRNTG